MTQGARLLTSRFTSAILAGVFALLLFIPFVSVGAQPAGQGLEISPPLIDLKADPGQTITTQVKVRNVTKDTLVVKAQYEDFVAGDEEGHAKVLLDEKDKSPYSIKDWLNTPSSVTLASGERKTVDISIVVPKDASPGGHYGIVRFTGAPPELEDSGVSLSASIGTLILVNVSGNVTQSAKIVELFTSQKGKKAGFFEYGPVSITTRLENTGNIHFKPKGTVQVTNMLGKNVYVGQFNSDNRNVLPGSIRRFEQTLDKKLMFGRYKVRADVVYGTDNQIASQTTTFWVIPYKLIAIILLAVILLVIALRQYNKFIIKRAGKKSGSSKKSKKTQDS